MLKESEQNKTVANIDDLPGERSRVNDLGYRMAKHDVDPDSAETRTIYQIVLTLSSHFLQSDDKYGSLAREKNISSRSKHSHVPEVFLRMPI